MSEIQDSFYRLAPQIIDLDPSDEGVIEFSDRRFVFFYTDLFKELFDDMKEVAGPVIETRIKKFGKTAGDQIASKLDEDFKNTSVIETMKILVGSGFNVSDLKTISDSSPRAQMEKIFGLGMYDGWIGHAEVMEYQEGEELAVEAENTFESQSHGQTGETECKFLTGVVEGMTGYFWDVEVEAEETQCACQEEYSSCRIELSRVEDTE
ncbi:MAG: hypothetical protein ABEJ69_02345 [Candidatus Nanohaloarchaea archaeon]